MSRNPTSKMPRIFDTDRRIKLGVWGLGRGRSFYSTCRLLNIDIVAGCDYNAPMRQHFLEHNPGAFVTDNADEFLAQDFDAVLLATYAIGHAPDAIRCLAAGKHVLSEVTAFFSLAEAVRLVEAVEKSGRVYQLAENYPFSRPNRYLARRWAEGLFGELMYAEFEYVHECRKLCYTYIDNQPVQPGWAVHNWRSWMNFHYYCTHSLGPVMLITGTRPTKVVSLPGRQRLAGYLVDAPEGMGGITPSLITMNNGGLVRNLMGATTNDAHVQRLWGTLGAAELNIGKPLQLRLGAAGGGAKLEVVPTLDELGQLAAGTGHGGGDFWVLYYFARQILTGEPGPFDVYAAADVTLPGILAYRSSMEDGRPFDVPDLRDPAQRDRCRNDTWQQKAYDVKQGVFPAGADTNRTSSFSTVMANLIDRASTLRNYTDWFALRDEMAEPARLVDLAEDLVLSYPQLAQIYRAARALADAFPRSDGARVLNEMLDVGREREAMAASFLPTLKRQLATLRRKYAPDNRRVVAGSATEMLPAPEDWSAVRPPAGRGGFKPMTYHIGHRFLDLRPIHGGHRTGLIFVRTDVKISRAGRGELRCDFAGVCRIWLNGRLAVATRPKAKPGSPGTFVAPVAWRKGNNEIVAALGVEAGVPWGFTARAVRTK